MRLVGIYIQLVHKLTVLQIRHQATCHHQEWLMVEEEDFNERKIDEEDDETMRFIWCCARCRDTPEEIDPMSLSSMEDHYAVQ